MSEQKTGATGDSLAELAAAIDDFAARRNWQPFHSPANLAKSIVIEAAELLECFQWSETDYDRHAAAEELADVMNYCIRLASVMGLDIGQTIREKMAKNELKYPVEKAWGSSLHYDRFDTRRYPEKHKQQDNPTEHE